MLQGIAATPIIAGGLEWPVQMWDEDAGTGIGTLVASDGRVAMGHRWTDAERAWLADDVAGWRSVEILDLLPADRELRQDDRPGRR